jgi:hypothetical protein
LRLAEGSGGWEGLGNSLAMDGAGETKLRVVARIVRFGAVAGGLTASTGDGGNRAWAQIAKRGDLAQDLSTLSLKSGQGIGHGGVSFLSNQQHSEAVTQKKKRSGVAPFMSRTPSAALPDFFIGTLCMMVRLKANTRLRYFASREGIYVC